MATKKTAVRKRSVRVAATHEAGAAAAAGDPAWLTAVRAAEDKQARDITVLDLRPVSAFADFFVICTGSNPRQVQAIADEVGKKLAERGEHPANVEGYKNAEWVLADYGDLVVHVYSPAARAYYGLERLWQNATPVPVPAADAGARADRNKS